MTWIDLNPPSASDRIKYFCNKFTGYPNPHLVINDNGLGLYVIYIPWADNYVQMGYARIPVSGGFKHFIIAFSNLETLKKYFPILYRPLIIAYPVPGGSPEIMESTISNCENCRIGIPDYVPFDVIKEALKSPDKVHAITEITVSPSNPNQNPLPDPREYTEGEFQIVPDANPNYIYSEPVSKGSGLGKFLSIGLLVSLLK